MEYLEIIKRLVDTIYNHKEDIETLVTILVGLQQLKEYNHRNKEDNRKAS